jgi:hypothetical protein
MRVLHLVLGTVVVLLLTGCPPKEETKASPASSGKPTTTASAPAQKAGTPAATGAGSGW